MLALCLLAPLIGARSLLRGALVDVDALASEVHAFLRDGESKTLAEWHAEQAHLMEVEKQILTDAKAQAGDPKAKAAGKHAVEMLVGLLKEWGTAQDARMAGAKQHMDEVELQGVLYVLAIIYNLCTRC